MKRLSIAQGADPEWKPPAFFSAALLEAIGKLREGRFIFRDGPGQKSVLEFQRCHHQALRALAALRRLGSAPGDRLILDAGDPRHFIPALWAALLGGYVAVPMASANWNAAGKRQFQQRLGYVSQRLNGATILADDEAAFSSAGHVLPYRDLFAEDDVAESIMHDPALPAVLILTSGTTGRPQLVTLSGKALAHRWWPRPSANDTAYLGWMPLEHVMGLGLASPSHRLKMQLSAESFVRDPRSWLDAASEHGITHAGMTNFGMKLITDAAGEDRHWDLSRLRRVGVGAEAISPLACSGFFRLISCCGAGPDVVALGYGLTECGPIAGGQRAFDPCQEVQHNAPLPIDGPTAGHSMRIVDSTGSICNEGVVGLIEVKGLTMASDYYADEQASAALFTADGWLRTGDIGVMQDGVLTVLGREKETLSVNARKYALSEIEAVLDGLRGASACHVFLDNDAALGERPSVAYVAGEPSPGLEKRIRESIVRHFGFGILRCVPLSASEVPRTASGKLQRWRLAEMFRHQVARAEPAVPSAATPVERLKHLLARFLGGTVLKEDDNFFEKGGDSLSALLAAIAIEQEFAISLPPATFATNATPMALLAHIQAGSGSAGRVELVSVKTVQDKATSLFLAPGVLGSNGYAVTFARALPGRLGAWTFHLRDPSDPTRRMLSLEEFARACTAEMLKVQPSGLFHLAGHSFGGQLAYAMACHLAELGHGIGSVSIFGAEAPLFQRHFDAAARPRPRLVFQAHRQLAANHVAPPGNFRISYFRPKNCPHTTPSNPGGGWEYLARGGVDRHETPGEHHSMVHGTAAVLLARSVSEAIDGKRTGQHLPFLNVSEDARASIGKAIAACLKGDLETELRSLKDAVGGKALLPHWVYSRLMQAGLAAGNTAEALHAYREALARDPWPLGTRARLIGELAAMGLDAQVQESVEYARNARIDSAACAFAMFRIFKSRGIWSEAELAVRQGIDLARKGLELRVELVSALMAQKKHSIALREIKSALVQASDNNFALRRLGYMALHLNAHALTEECFRRSVQIDPEDDPNMLHILKNLAAMQGNEVETKRLGELISELSQRGLMMTFDHSDNDKNS